MAKFNETKEKSVRVVLPLSLYNDVKARCEEYGDISRVVRYLLKRWVEANGTVRQTYDDSKLFACLPTDSPPSTEE